MSSVIAEIVYGHRVTGPDEAYPHIAERVTEILVGAGTPGLNLVDIFPIRKITFDAFSHRGLSSRFKSVMHLPEWFPGAWLIKYGNSAFAHSVQPVVTLLTIRNSTWRQRFDLNKSSFRLRHSIGL